MSHVSKNLAEDEVILTIVSLSNWFWIWRVLLVPFYGIGIFLIISGIMYKVSTEIGCTNKRVFGKTGVIFRKTIDIRLDKVEAIMVSQSLISRFFRYGSVTVIGTGGTKGKFKYIVSPLIFRKRVQELSE